MIIKNESDSHEPIISNTLDQTKELDPKGTGPLTEHYEVPGFAGVGNRKKATDYSVH
ncbi:hypothetical protein [Clostridium vincentii]|uniref:Uncharacterized protein n=1 Tax=Clostridium vincentii TaxID=52704 RepID=A0A2T0BFA8_9CLOT|nr:hypothetical protein [Clostridium vincentii]PRR82548.1 hypothetical protein CLVI_16830 [Clostridium vincentii]